MPKQLLVVGKAVGSGHGQGLAVTKWWDSVFQWHNIQVLAVVSQSECLVIGGDKRRVVDDHNTRNTFTQTSLMRMRVSKWLLLTLRLVTATLCTEASLISIVGCGLWTIDRGLWVGGGLPRFSLAPSVPQSSQERATKQGLPD